MSNMANRTIKIWSLMDGDPHGIDIHVVYKWGGRVSIDLLVTFTRQIFYLISFKVSSQ